MTADASWSEEETHWMRLALAAVSDAGRRGEVPVGAVIVRQGQLLAVGSNSPVGECDASAHAEIMALRAAGRSLGNYRLPGACMYVTLEPCTMCVGALIHARIDSLVYATSEPRAGALVSARSLLEDGYYNHRFSFRGGLLAAESRQLLQDFFRQRRGSA